MRRWGKGEIISAVPVADPKTATLTENVEVHLGGATTADGQGGAKITMHREILERFADGQCFGGFQALKFETEADRRRAAREQA